MSSTVCPARMPARSQIANAAALQSLCWTPSRTISASPVPRAYSRSSRALISILPAAKNSAATVECARDRLLNPGDESVDQIAARVGYADGVTLRALLRRRLGYGVREIRKSD